MFIFVSLKLMVSFFPYSTIDKSVLEIQHSQWNSVDKFKKSEGPVTDFHGSLWSKQL